MLKNLVPLGLRDYLRAQLGITDRDRKIAALETRLLFLEGQCARLEKQSLESKDEVWERSRQRWRNCRPDRGLTWGFTLDADAFVRRVEAHGGFGAEKTILEIGPGYGRIPRSLLSTKVPFAAYHGVDISASNVETLRREVIDPRLNFLHGDAESTAIPAFDTLVSSLVFKHLYPSFQKLLANCGAHAKPNALACFDLIEGEARYFEEDGVTYIRHYTRGDAREGVEAAGWMLEAFDEVLHREDFKRLLVVARKAG